MSAAGLESTLKVGNSERGVRILSLDGGGVRGLSALLILRHLMKRIDPQNPPKPCEYFDIIAGTSTGGIIAIMLGRLQMSVNECIEKYKELSNRVFKPKRQYNILGKAKDLLKLDGAFDAAELEAVSRQVIQEAGENHDAKLLERSSGCKVFVCAMRAEITRPVRFRSYETAYTVQDVDCTIVEAIRATSAATSFFSPITIDGQVFIDAAAGGYNNPVNEVLEEYHQIWGESGRKVERFISIGTGIPNLRAFGKNIFELGKTLVKIATDTQETADEFERDAVRANGLNGLYFRFNARGMEGVGLEDRGSVGKIIAATNNYLNEYRTLQQINAFATLTPVFLNQLQQQAYLRSLPTYDLQSELCRIAEPIGETFAWVTDTEEFWSWYSKDGPPILQIVGKPGCGKSVLFAWLLQHQLIESHIAYFACTQSDRARRLPEMILSSLLHQILSQQPNLFRYVMTENYMSESRSYAQLWVLFKAVLTSPDNTGIICMIDALDECLQETQTQFVRDLWSLSDHLTRPGTAGYSRLLITSRNYVNLRIPHAICLDLDESPRMIEDVKVFISYKVSRLIDQRPEYGPLVDVIFEQLESRARGMYRLIDLIVEELYAVSDSSTQSIYDILRSVPYTIGEIYDNIWERIRMSHRSRAKKLFAWILCSFSPLDNLSLSLVAAALKWPGATADQIAYHIPNDVFGDARRLFGPLVSIGTSIEVSHPTVKDYFLRNDGDYSWTSGTNCIGSAEAHSFIAVTCLGYLNSFSEIDFDDISPNGLLEYSLKYFAGHVAQAEKFDDDLDQQIVVFFDKAIWMDHWHQTSPHNLSTDSAQIDPITDALSFACYYGRSNLMKKLISERPKHLSCSKGICVKSLIHLLHIALVGLHEDCVQEVTNLFDQASFDLAQPIRFYEMVFGSTNDEGFLDLSRETWSCNEMADYVHQHQIHNTEFHLTEVTQISRKHQISRLFEILYSDKTAQRPSQSPSFGYLRDCTHSTGLLFTEYMISSYGKDSTDVLNSCSPALWEAISNNRVQAVKYLLEAGASLETYGPKGSSILHTAAKSGNKEVVGLILKRQTLDVNAVDVEGKTPLHYACSAYRYGEDAMILEERPLNISREGVIALLLKFGAQRTAKDVRGNTPFQTLAHVFIPEWDDVPKGSKLNWREQDLNGSIELLLQDLSDVVEWDSSGSTVLHYAAYKWPTSAVKQLLQFLDSFRVSPCLLDNLGYTPLHYAAIRGFDNPEQVVELLCQAGVDPRVRQITGVSALSIAREYARAACVKKLEFWEHKLDLSSESYQHSLWLTDKFEVDSNQPRRQSYSTRSSKNHYSQSPKVVIVTPTNREAPSKEQIVGRRPPKRIFSKFPSMEIAVRINSLSLSICYGTSPQLPKIFPRTLIESFTFIQYDLTRGGGFSQLTEESLVRPLSQERWQYIQSSSQVDLIPGENYHSLNDDDDWMTEDGSNDEYSDQNDNLDYDNEPNSSHQIVSNPELSHHYGEEQLQYDTDFYFPPLNPLKVFFVWLLILTWLLWCTMSEIDNKEQAFPLGAQYKGPGGFYLLQHASGAWEIGNRVMYENNIY